MMKWKLILVSIVIVILFISQNLFSQFLNANRYGIGLNMGGAKIFCENPHTGFGFATELYAKYKINPRFFSVLALGYSELSDGTMIVDNKCTFSTDLITFDIKGGVNLLTEGRFIPFAYLGLGVFRFQAEGSAFTSPNLLNNAFYDAAFMLGGGIETRISPKIAITANLDYRYTTGDDLNGINNQQDKDGYLTIKSGVTYYIDPAFTGASDKDLKIAEDVPIEELDGQLTDDQELAALIEGVDGYGETADANTAMEEYITLKSRVDELNDSIRQKELEIGELKIQLDLRKEKVAQLEENLQNRSGGRILAASLNADLGDFAASYEQALQHFYSKDYDAAIYLFNMLVETSPDHKLVSNCYYWLGECYFGQNEFSTAIEFFEKIFSYKISYKKDDALLMMGRCYIKMGDKSNAQAMLEQLLSDYPDSEYIRKAGQYLSY